MTLDQLSGDLAWQRASDLAARRHQHQLRDNDLTPYIAHPMRVAITLSAVFGVQDERILAAAILHDLIEDTPVDHDEIVQHFDAEIAEWVSAMSKDMRLKHDVREAAYDEQLAAAAWPARLIKLGDVFDNLSDATGDKIASGIKKAHRAIGLAGEEPELQVAVQHLKERVASIESRAS